jgi:hypothetical protein
MEVTATLDKDTNRRNTKAQEQQEKITSREVAHLTCLQIEGGLSCSLGGYRKKNYMIVMKNFIELNGGVEMEVEESELRVQYPALINTSITFFVVGLVKNKAKLSLLKRSKSSITSRDNEARSHV